MDRIDFIAMHDGKNPQKVMFSIERTGDPGVYNEVGIAAIGNNQCVAYILIGINEAGEVRILTTSNEEGDGDHTVAIYPQRSGQDIVDLAWQ